MLDQLGTVDVGYKNRSHEWLIHFFHQIDRMIALRADHDPIGVHQVADCASFPKKFRVADDVELCAVTIVTLDRLSHFFAGLNGHGAFIDNDAIAGQDPGNLPRDFFNET